MSGGSTTHGCVRPPESVVNGSVRGWTVGVRGVGSGLGAGGGRLVLRLVEVSEDDSPSFNLLETAQQNSETGLKLSKDARFQSALTSGPESTSNRRQR